MYQNGKIRAKSYEKEELTSSDQWQLVDHSSWLEHEAGCYTAGACRKAMNSITDVLNAAFSSAKSGTLAILAIGIELKQLKREFQVLTKNKDSRIWGDRREKIQILKDYGMSEHRFDHNTEERELVLSFIRCHIKRKEKLMREIAKDFNIDIPINPEFTILGDNRFTMNEECKINGNGKH